MIIHPKTFELSGYEISVLVQALALASDPERPILSPLDRAKYALNERALHFAKKLRQELACE